MRINSSKDPNAVSFRSQTLIPADKRQARRNIGLADPIVVLVTGQSNPANTLSYSWTVPPNLFAWDGHSTSPGTAFSIPSFNFMNLALGFGNAMARANADREVYIINIARGSQAISQWLPAPSDIDMYAACKAATEAALTNLGVSKIDHLIWWQGESDLLTGNLDYVEDFQTVIERFIDETWFERDTSVTVMGVSPWHESTPKMRIFNDTLRQAVNLEPQFRTFVDTSVFDADTYWDLAGLPYLHMNAAGLALAGALAYKTAFNGSHRSPPTWQTVIKKEYESRSATTALADDTELRIYLTAGQHRIRGSVYAASVAAADFKFGFSGPTLQDGQSVITVVKGETPAVESAYIDIQKLTTAYPTDQTVLIGSDGAFRINFDLSIDITAAGNFAFQWAQNASTVTVETRVNQASYIEVAKAA